MKTTPKRKLLLVLTVAVVNLAIGPRTFRPSIFGKIATATYILTGVITRNPIIVRQGK